MKRTVENLKEKEKLGEICQDGMIQMALVCLNVAINLGIQ
jgi:hypothetical protein